MTLLIFLHVLNIIAIMGLAFYVRHIQGSKPYSLFWSFIFFLCGRYKGIKWFLSNPMYLVRQLLFGVLISIDITLIGQFMDNNVFHRLDFLLLLSPIAWVLVWINYYYIERKH